MSTDSEDLSSKGSVTHLIDEESYGGNMGGIVLKKGPWTSAEDAILIDYVKNHGEGNWNNVQKHAGLYRCGKSCRLRWANHLRPNLKKGAFTAEEERLIIDLHAKMGNKWARMAAHLPGRTDNEIKNYWNTRIKRRQRAGLPLYPPEACLQALLDGQSEVPVRISSRGYAETNNYGIPDITFHSMPASQGVLSFVPEPPNISSSSLLLEAIGTTRRCSLQPLQHPKRFCESGSNDHGSAVSTKTELPVLETVEDDAKGSQSLDLLFQYDCNPFHYHLSLGEAQDSQYFINNNFSASTATSVAVKSELPSFQYIDTDVGSLDASHSVSPILHPFDTFVPEKTSKETFHSECSSPRNSGLLDALVYEARSIGGVKKLSSDKSSNSSAVSHSDFAGGSGLMLCETEFGNNSEAMSPLGSATLFFSESGFTASQGFILDNDPFAGTFTGCKSTSKSVDHSSYPVQENSPAVLDYLEGSSPFYSDWFQQESEAMKQTAVNEAVAATLTGNDLDCDLKHMDFKIPSQGWGIGSCVWNNMPTVCHMSRFP